MAKRKLIELRVGARFRLKPDGPVWVLIENWGCGLIASFEGHAGNVGGWAALGEVRYCSAAETPEEAVDLIVFDSH